METFISRNPFYRKLQMQSEAIRRVFDHLHLELAFQKMGGTLKRYATI